uniref:DUF1156 domain-containing protein n=1 Tax=Thermofilum pendens TaxID=2269 RepID=A0A7C3WJQ2_THEPE
MASLIESPRFPVEAVNKASAAEKGAGRPKYWEMVFWWTRKPLAGARAVVAGALAPDTVEPEEFLRWVYPSYRGGEFARTPHRDSPDLPAELRERLRSVKLLDPFAGFGSIPLEAIRLGVGEVVAVELLPTAYIFLKAILEYPKAYGELRVKARAEEIRELGLEGAARRFTKAGRLSEGGEHEVPALVYDVARWGRWVIDQLGRDPDIRELYGDDVAVYIGTWEVKCPVCGRYTPLVGNWWLARVKGRRHAYMVPRAEGDEVRVEVVEGMERGAPEPNVRARQERARCLLCGSDISLYDPEAGRAYSSRREVKDRRVKERLAFYPKHAIRDWSTKLEQYLDGAIKLEELRGALARPRLLVKVKIANRDLAFEPATKEDNEKLWKALEKLKQMWGDPDIPTEPLPHYDQEFARMHLWGFDKWFKLFNPRQLLALVKLVKLIREVGRRVEEEFLFTKLYEFARATIVFDSPEVRQMRRHLVEVIRSELSKLYGGEALDIARPSTLADQLLKYSLNAFDKIFEATFKSLEVLQKPNDNELRRAKISILEEVVKIKHGKSKVDEIKKNAYRYAEAVTTYLAIVLCKHADWNSMVSGWQLSYLIAAHTLAMRGIAMVWNWGEYNPLSDYRGTWKAMTNNIIDGLSYLVSAVSGSPSRVRVLLDDATTLSKLGGERFDLIVTDPPYRGDVAYAELSDFYYVWLKRALSDSDGTSLAPRFHRDALIYSTQWEALSVSEVSYSEGRAEFFGLSGEEHYRRLMADAFKRMSELVKDGGAIVTYFAHSSPEAWMELVEAGWERARLRVSAAWSVVSESEERVTARGKTALASSIVVVWRKRGDSAPRMAEYSDVRAKAEESAARALRHAVASKLEPADVFLATMVGALSELTSYDKLTRFGREMGARDIVRESYAVATRVVAGATEAVSSPEALLYLACKALYRRHARSPAREIVLSSQDIIVLSYGLTGKEREAEGVKRFVASHILKPTAATGAEVSKQKAFKLLEPLNTSIDTVRELLGERGVDPVKLVASNRELNTVDVLHLLEYYARMGKKEFDSAYRELLGISPSLVREALEVTRVIAGMDGDPEKYLCTSLLDKLR